MLLYLALLARVALTFTSYCYVKNYFDTNQSAANDIDCLGLGVKCTEALSLSFMSTPNETDVKFYLSSRDQRNRVEMIVGNQFGLEWADFRTYRSTIVIVHGFLSHGNESWINEMEKSFLQWGDVNVVVVDWSSNANTWNYFKAAVNTKIVGNQISRFFEHIENAVNDEGMYGDLHMVGHSLGAHICGFAAKELKKLRSKFIVKRITGLDPAQPCFKDANPDVTLHKTDALYVDVIHTNGKLLTQLGLGLPESIGHVDFYPNGGKSQPGCADIDVSYYQYLPLPIEAIRNSICSHGRAYDYLTESLISHMNENCTFWAHPWNLSYRSLRTLRIGSCTRTSCTQMGINAIKFPKRGTFFVATSNSMPFCLNDVSKMNEIIAQQVKDNEEG